MSTKNLARTVLEAGRASSGTWGRREDNARLRSAVRARLADVRDDGEADAVLFPVIKKRNRHLDDKLGAPKRWLVSQVGRPWDLVRSELFQRFDTRTTAGRHIIFGHMLEWVEVTPRPDRGGWRRELYVDRHGILRRTPDAPRPRFSWSWGERLPRDKDEIERWLDGRRVGTRGDVLFWFTPTPGNAYRQHHRLDDDDVAAWRSLPEWFRERNDPGAPPPLPHNRN